MSELFAGDYPTWWERRYGRSHGLPWLIGVTVIVVLAILALIPGPWRREATNRPIPA